MRWMLMCTAAVASITASVSGSQAATNYPWCVTIYDRNGETTSCGFVNASQCEATLSGQRGRCFRNPSYQPGRPHVTGDR